MESSLPNINGTTTKGADLKGKVLLMMNNDPSDDPELFAGKRRLYYGRWDYKYQMAARQGAAGAIIIHTTPSAGYPFQVVQRSWTGEQFQLKDKPGPHLEMAGWFTEDAARGCGSVRSRLGCLAEVGRVARFQAGFPGNSAVGCSEVRRA